VKLAICTVAHVGNPAPFSGAGASGCEYTRSTGTIITGSPEQQWLTQLRDWTDIDSRFRVCHRVAQVLPDLNRDNSERNHAGLPNFHEDDYGQGVVFGSVFIKPDFWEPIDIRLDVLKIH
jgi:hypothetical protein